MKLTRVVEILLLYVKLTKVVADSVGKFLAENQSTVSIPLAALTPAEVRKLPFGERAGLTKIPPERSSSRLWKGNRAMLSVAADVNTARDTVRELLALADAAGQDICVLIMHVDIFLDFTPEFGRQLREIVDKYDFLVFEDRKFADIGNTVTMQYEGDICKIVEWADITNAHIVPGAGIVDGLRLKGLPKGRGFCFMQRLARKESSPRGNEPKRLLRLLQIIPNLLLDLSQPTSLHGWEGQAALR